MPQFKLSTSLQSKFAQLPDSSTVKSIYCNGQGQGTSSAGGSGSIVNAAFSKFKDLRQSNLQQNTSAQLVAPGQSSASVLNMLQSPESDHSAAEVAV